MLDFIINNVIFVDYNFIQESGKKKSKTEQKNLSRSASNESILANLCKWSEIWNKLIEISYFFFPMVDIE